ncbi:hypothetical protein D5F01_LYC21272 [Larimichthys crocea]|uniref:Uncharacterized protein n=1 Tax=Larimichthys crocea TaxID=215358 RepID=A0A6G0HN95_LARCR|nr:hypothetical protein D5F01_LYC21272 [Larimichthys crocea]
MPASAEAQDSASSFEIDKTMVSDVLNRSKENVGELLTSVSQWRDEAQDSASPESYVTERVSRNLHRFFTLRKAFAEIQPSAQHQDPSPTPSASSSTSETAEALVSDILGRAKQKLMMSELSEVSLASDEEDLVEKEMPGEDARGTEEENAINNNNEIITDHVQKKKMPWWRNIFKNKKVLPVTTLKKEEVSQPLPATETQCKDKLAILLMPASAEAQDSASSFEIDKTMVSDVLNRSKENVGELLTSVSQWRDEAQDSASPESYVTERVSRNLHRCFTLRKAFAEIKPSAQHQDPSPTPSASSSTSETAEALVSDILDRAKQKLMMSELSEVSLASDEEDLVEKEMPGEDARGTEEEDAINNNNEIITDHVQKKKMPWWRNIFKKKKVLPVTTLKKDEVSQPLPATETQCKDKLAILLMPASAEAQDSASSFEIDKTMVSDVLNRSKENVGELLTSVSQWRDEAQDSASPESYVTERVSRNLHRFFTLRKAFAEIQPSAQHQDPSPTPSASSSTSETAEALVSDILDRAKQKLMMSELSEVSLASDEEDLVEKEMPGEDARGTEEEDAINNNNEIITDHVQKKKMPWWRNIFKKKKVLPVTTLKKDEVSQPLPATETQCKDKLAILLMPASAEAQDSASSFEIDKTMVSDVLNRSKENVGELLTSVSQWRDEAQDSASPESYVTERVSRNLHRFFTLRKAFAEIQPSAQHQDPSPTPSASSSTSETAEALVSDILDRAKQKLMMSELSEVSLASDEEDLVEKEMPGEDARGTEEEDAINNNNEIITDHVQKKKMPWWRNIFKNKKVLPVTTLKKEEVSQPLPATETQCKDKLAILLMPASAEAQDSASSFEIDKTMVSDVLNRSKENVGELLTSVSQWRDEAQDSASPESYVTERVSRNLHRFFTLRKAFAEIKPSAQHQDPSPTPSASSSTSETAEALVSDILDRAKQKLMMSELSEVSLASDEEDLVEKEMPGEDARGTEEEDAINNNNEIITDHVQKKKMPWWRNIFKNKKVLPVTTLKKEEVSQPLPATETQVRSPAMCNPSSVISKI